MITVEVLRNKTLTGYLSQEDDFSYTFQYDSQYITNKNAQAISVNLPVREEAFYSKNLFAFFDNMLTEGEAKQIQCQNLGIAHDNHFARLIATAKNDVIGSVHIGRKVKNEVL